MPNDSSQDRKRTYTVLEEVTVVALLERLLPEADLEDVRRALADVPDELQVVYTPIDQLTAYNADRALTQAGRRFIRDQQPPRLAAVPSRNWQPKRIVVDHEPRVSLA